MFRCLGIGLFFLLSGCGSTTPVVVAPSLPPKIPYPPASLMVAPPEFIPMPEGPITDDEALDIATQNNLNHRLIYLRLLRMQEWVRSLHNDSSVDTPEDQ